MNSIEERLWNYIDGNCTPDEHKAVALLIQHDDLYIKKYNELLEFNNEIALLELDQPSMAFTYNVLESIRTQHTGKPLKARVNKHIIVGIAAFFILILATILIYAFSKVNWTAGETIKVPEQFTVNANKVNTIFSGPVIKGFLFFDLVAGLFLVDYYLRQKLALRE